MILKFAVKNYCSIKDQLELNFQISNKYKEIEKLDNNFSELLGNKLINSMIIYGRNAAGKSNILNAIRSLKLLVINSDKFTHGEKITYYRPFLLEEGTVNSPTQMAITFIGENKIKYDYSISFDDSEIISEALYYYPNNFKTKLFERTNFNFVYGESFKGEKKMIEDAMIRNQLFLSKTASYNIPYLKEAYLYFKKYLLINISVGEDYERALLNTFTKYSAESGFYKNNLKKLIKVSDVSIQDYEVTEKQDTQLEFPLAFPENVKKEILNRYRYSINMVHNYFSDGIKVGIKNLPLDIESLGTKKLLSVGGVILTSLITGGVVVIDELDKSLHPLLVRMLINLFHSKKNNPNNAQLIFATHDSSLLDSELFRRDQIGIVEKDSFGSTEFCRISDFKGVRKNIPLDKWYLSGRFQGIPSIDDIELEFE